VHVRYGRGQRGEQRGLVRPRRADTEASPVLDEQCGEIEVHQPAECARDLRPQRIEVARERQPLAEVLQRGAVVVAVPEEQVVRAAQPAVQRAERDRGEQREQAGRGKAVTSPGRTADGPIVQGVRDGCAGREQQDPEQAVHKPTLEQAHIQDVVAQDGIGEAHGQKREPEGGVLRARAHGLMEQQGREVERGERQDAQRRTRAHDRQPAAHVARALPDTCAG